MSKRSEKRDREGRTLGINSQRPTPRDRWTALYRLWRLAGKNAGSYQSMVAIESLWVLLPACRMTGLLTAADNDGLVERSHLPKELRKSMLAALTRKRLYGGKSELAARDRIVANQMRDNHGIEMTPEQVGEARYTILKTIREQAAIDGVEIPDSDGELLDVLASALRGKIPDADANVLDVLSDTMREEP